MNNLITRLKKVLLVSLAGAFLAAFIATIGGSLLLFAGILTKYTLLFVIAVFFLLGFLQALIIAIRNLKGGYKH